MVRPVPELCFWWAISQPCLGFLRSLGPLQGPGPADLFSGFAVAQSTSVSEPMPPMSKRCKCSLHRFFHKIFPSLDLTYWQSDSHIGRVEAGKMVRSVAELCLWWAISKSCLGLLRSLGPIYRSQKMRARKRWKCSFHLSFRKIFSSTNLTNLLTDSNIGRVEAGKLVFFASGGQFAFAWPDVEIPEDPCLERVRCKCSFQRFFRKIFSSINLTDWLTDSHIGRV